MSSDRSQKPPPPYVFRSGTGPLIVGMPHAGTYIPPEIEALMTNAALEQPDMAWHVEELTGFAPTLGAASLASTTSRYVVDLNRSPDGLNRHAGLNNTTLCTVERFDGKNIYHQGMAPDVTEVARRVDLYWQPYHARLRQELTALHDTHGLAVLLDIHTIPSRADRFYDDRSPEIALKSGARRRADPDLVERLNADLAADGRYTFEVDGRYQGGYIVQTYGAPEHRFHSLQIEISQATYMSESSGDLLPEKAAALSVLLSGLAGTILAWAAEAPRGG